MESNDSKTGSTPDPELRFGFGRNWERFLSSLNEDRLGKSQQSIEKFWPREKEAISFLDIGSGSGTFSLIARRLGAKVHSFDYDEFSVACTEKLKQMYFEDDPQWKIEQGSALDVDYLKSLGLFDIVYSWGVLHHTGAMWQALENATIPVASDGQLVVAIYNDQGWKSKLWKLVKKTYCSGTVGRLLISAIFIPLYLLVFLIADLLRFRNPVARYRSNTGPRGMAVVTDIIDWIGGYPFEVATPEEIISFYEKHGFKLQQQKLTKRLGCNEFVFQKQ